MCVCGGAWGGVHVSGGGWWWGGCVQLDEHKSHKQLVIVFLSTVLNIYILNEVILKSKRPHCGIMISFHLIFSSLLCPWPGGVSYRQSFTWTSRHTLSRLNLVICLIKAKLPKLLYWQSVTDDGGAVILFPFPTPTPFPHVPRKPKLLFSVTLIKWLCNIGLRWFPL